ncbi:MAG TPA: HNH endonuclease [Gammaproteobacteria bacterium]|nr:HNH endonuclease [Gammaproteobacteria bacterium]HEV2212360.1 HNH endonuclease [Gammaproteobacteria bacterium]HEV2321765.1 HNH endonuclease [Gammaproteobacteria bacterium]HEV2332022.1 HNH endonuclease [Gammaproteobacteria bacterium]
MNDLSQEVLRTDSAGVPLEWIDYQDAVKLYHLDQVAYGYGSPVFRLHGGINAKTGRRSVIEVNSIIATYGNNHALAKARAHYVPPLNNHTLFKRDAHVCMYCGKRFSTGELSREHVTPLSRGGHDNWTNVVTACKRCNNHKAGRTPEEARMQLLAIPFTPNHAEYIFLKGRRILADQMQFLLAHFPRSSPLHSRVKQLLV